MRWQYWARAGIAVAGVSCAVAVYFLYGARPPAGAPPAPAIDPTTTSQMNTGTIVRQKDGVDSLRIGFDARTTFSDGRVRFDRVHIQSFDERGLEIWAALVETEGKSEQADNPALLRLSGNVRFLTKDGLECRMERGTYNDITGMLVTPGEMTFTKARMSGDGLGATYDNKQDVLTLLERAHVRMAPDAQGGGTVDATSHKITVIRPAKTTRLEGDARIVRDGDTLSAETAVVHTTEEESRLTRIELRTRAQVAPAQDKGGAAPPAMRADDIDLDLHDDGQTIRHADMTGRTAPASVDMTGSNGGHQTIDGSHIDFDLAADGQTLTHLDAARLVSVTIPKTADAEKRTIHADTLHAIGKEPVGLTNAQFDGGQGRPVRFEEDVVPSGGGATTTRRVDSQRLVLFLNGQLDSMDHATFTGLVNLTDTNGNARAEIADYDAKNPKNRTMLLHRPEGGSGPLPSAENSDGRHVDGRTITLFLDSASNDLDAAGEVLTISKPARPAAGHAASPLFAGESNIIGRAASLQYRGNRATYLGSPGKPAQISQDASVVKGDRVVFDSDTNNLKAEAHVESVMTADSNARPATGEPPAAPTTYHVTNADSLDYDDTARVAHFEGKLARLTSPDGVTTARSVEMRFEPDSNSIRQMIWDGTVTADLTSQRRGIGAHLTYDAASEEYVLHGQAEVLVPRADGATGCSLSRGDTLRFSRTSGAASGGTDNLDGIPCDEKLPYKRKEGMATLRTEGLTKSYGGRTVVRDINLDVSSGEIVGLLGPNGAGKTTTFSMVVGLTGADSGQVLLDDARVTSDPMYVRARKGIGYLPQESSIFRGLTVEQNVMAILETLPIGAKERRRRLAELLGELNLTPLAQARAHTLSGGERRRVEITRALVSQPKFMLLDEPFAGIDPIAVGDIQKIIFHLRDLGIGVLITDHNVRETLKITDRAYIVHGGAIFRSGSPAGLAADDEVKRIYLGADFRLD